MNRILQIKRFDGIEYQLMDVQVRPLKHHAEQLKKIGTIEKYRISNGMLYVYGFKSTNTKSRYSNTQMGDKAYAELKGVSIHGLPKRKNGDVIYDNFNDYLFDFYPNLPWGSESQHAAIRHMMSKPDYKQTMDRIQRKFNFDMDADLKQALLNKE